MKKTTLVSLFLLIVATATFGQETTGYVKCGIGGKEVYLLDSPPNWTAVATLKGGDRVALLNEQNDNFTVRTKDGKQGYISHYFLSAATPAPPPPVSAQQPSGVGTKASPQAQAASPAASVPEVTPPAPAPAPAPAIPSKPAPEVPTKVVSFAIADSSLVPATAVKDPVSKPPLTAPSVPGPPRRPVFAVQVGAFKDRARADALAAKLSGRYQQTILVAPATVENQTIYQVRFLAETKPDAKTLAASLSQNDNLLTWIVAPCPKWWHSPSCVARPSSDSVKP